MMLHFSKGKRTVKNHMYKMETITGKLISFSLWFYPWLNPLRKKKKINSFVHDFKKKIRESFYQKFAVQE